MNPVRQVLVTSGPIYDPTDSKPHFMDHEKTLPILTVGHHAIYPSAPPPEVFCYERSCYLESLKYGIVPCGR
jgi:hypothetical protein